jgi:hypothetical protein
LPYRYTVVAASPETRPGKTIREVDGTADSNEEKGKKWSKGEMVQSRNGWIEIE